MLSPQAGAYSSTPITTVDRGSPTSMWTRRICKSVFSRMPPCTSPSPAPYVGNISKVVDAGYKNGEATTINGLPNGTDVSILKHLDVGQRIRRCGRRASTEKQPGIAVGDYLLILRQSCSKNTDSLQAFL